MFAGRGGAAPSLARGLGVSLSGRLDPGREVFAASCLEVHGRLGEGAVGMERRDRHSHWKSSAAKVEGGAAVGGAGRRRGSGALSDLVDLRPGSEPFWAANTPLWGKGEETVWALRGPVFHLLVGFQGKEVALQAPGSAFLCRPHPFPEASAPCFWWVRTGTTQFWEMYLSPLLRAGQGRGGGVSMGRAELGELFFLEGNPGPPQSWHC